MDSLVDGTPLIKGHCVFNKEEYQQFRPPLQTLLKASVDQVDQDTALDIAWGCIQEQMNDYPATELTMEEKENICTCFAALDEQTPQATQKEYYQIITNVPTINDMVSILNEMEETIPGLYLNHYQRDIFAASADSQKLAQIANKLQVLKHCESLLKQIDEQRNIHSGDPITTLYQRNIEKLSNPDYADSLAELERSFKDQLRGLNLLRSQKESLLLMLEGVHNTQLKGTFATNISNTYDDAGFKQIKSEIESELTTQKKNDDQNRQVWMDNNKNRLLELIKNIDNNKIDENDTQIKNYCVQQTQKINALREEDSFKQIESDLMNVQLASNSEQMQHIKAAIKQLEDKASTLSSSSMLMFKKAEIESIHLKISTIKQALTNLPVEQRSDIMNGQSPQCQAVRDALAKNRGFHLGESRTYKNFREEFSIIRQVGQENEKKNETNKNPDLKQNSNFH